MATVTVRGESVVSVKPDEEREYDERGHAVHRGHSATSSTQVRLADTSIAGSVIKQVVARTGAQVDGPWWEIAADNPARLEACGRAASIARAKAEAYAEALGFRLGALAQITEPDPRVAPMGYTTRPASFGPLSAADQEIPIDSGVLEVWSIVDVTFTVEPN